MIAEFNARQWKQRTFLRTKEHMNNSFLVTMSTSTNKHRYKNKLAATLWWFTAAQKPLKIQVSGGHPAPRGRTAPIF